MNLAKHIQRLNAIADAGLTYGSAQFDKERYRDIKTVLEAMAQDLEFDARETHDMLRPTYWYPTPMVDTRAFVVNDKDQVLLVRDHRTHEWALPGGYGEIGMSPSENALKELHEEAGVEGEIVRLLAVFDTNKRQFQSRQYYKHVFLVKALSENFQENIETAEAQYFSVDDLPELSIHRTTPEQVKLLLELTHSGETIVD
jgi:ADP-ribose pyrophosphatase YjhB (NUDIX family)